MSKYFVRDKESKKPIKFIKGNKHKKVNVYRGMLTSETTFYEKFNFAFHKVKIRKQDDWEVINTTKYYEEVAQNRKIVLKFAMIFGLLVLDADEYVDFTHSLCEYYRRRL